MKTKLSKEKAEYFKKKLEVEKKSIEESLARVGQRNPANPEDWEVSGPDTNVMLSDKNEMADIFEDMGNKAAIEDKLEEKFGFINEALKRIKKGDYGICGVCGEMINEARLEAFPTAKNCIKHAQNHK